MFLSIRIILVLTIALITSSYSHAYPTNIGICGLGGTPNVAPGESFNLSYSVSAERVSDVTIPVTFWFSNSPIIDGSSIQIGSGSAFIEARGNYCSATRNITLTLPIASRGLDCFIPATSYIVAKAGDEQRAFAINPIGADTLPTLTDVSPSQGRPGSLIHVIGDNYDQSTGILLDGNSMPQALQPSELIGIVQANANSGAVAVKDLARNYCVPPFATTSQAATVSFSSFTVLPTAQYCDSGAQNVGFGNVSIVGMNGFTSDVSNTSVCPNYTNNTINQYGLTRIGKAEEALFLQVGSCGETPYDRMLKVYIDWNNDLDFNDEGEYILGAPYVNVDNLYQLDMPIPASAKPGTTRMRIITALYYNGIVESLDDVGACGYYPFGETQDYNIDMVPSDFANAMSVTLSQQPIELKKTVKLTMNGKPIQIKATGRRIQ